MIHATVFDTKPYDREHLSLAGMDQVQWQFHEFRLGPDTAAIAQTPAVVVFVNDKVDAACLKILAGQGVKHLALRCAGYNNVDLKAAKEVGIQVTRVPAYSPHAVAEHTLALLMTLNRKIHRAFNRVRELNFSLQGLVGFDLNSRTVGIVGTGKIGRITAEIFRGFGCRVLAFDIQPDQEWATKAGVSYVEEDQLFRASDVITLHVPLFPGTFHLINDKTIQMMKSGVYLVNTSRGKLVDTTALIQGLKSGHIGGVALDVYEEEEGIFFEDHSGQVLQDDELSRLLTFPNVLITSHQAFLTKEALNEIARVTVENMQRINAGEEALEDTRVGE